MSFISYAQNYEDVILWRALRDVGKGFYVDVGAHDPVVYSVTKAFYDRGWRGINIEPVQKYYQLLAKDRPEDLNLPIAVGDRKETKRFFEIPDSGLSTFSPETALRHTIKGWRVVEREVQVIPLSEVLRNHGTSAIHFMKIDVEGAEATVLRGLDLKIHRPWILVVEATRPMTDGLCFEEWEPMLLESEYCFVYFDGLNRFYVADEHRDLSERFNAPPNVFDKFVPYAQESLQQNLIEAEAEREAVAQKLVGVEAEREGFASEIVILRGRLAEESLVVVELRGALERLYNSGSWRFTAPLRAARRWLTFGVQVSRGAGHRLIRALWELLRLDVRMASKYPALFRLASRVIPFSLVRRTANYFQISYPKLWKRLRYVGFYQVESGSKVTNRKKDQQILDVVGALKQEIARQRNM